MPPLQAHQTTSNWSAKTPWWLEYLAAAPTVVNEFGNEFTTSPFAGQTSRELRVWPEQKLLMIMYFRCSSVIHACTRPATNDWRIRFFALSDPVHPLLVSTYFLRLS